MAWDNGYIEFRWDEQPPERLPAPSIAHWDCEYCRARVMWNAGERIPLKCHSCGAPPTAPRQRYSMGFTDPRILYGCAILRPDTI